MNEMSIGKRIQKLRKQHQLSQQELAEQIGISRQTIGKWEQDLSLPDIEMLLAMAKVFNTPLTTLIGVEAETNSVSELYDQIKNVQTNLEKSNKSKSIFQYVLILICITSLGLMISMKQQLDQQASYYTNNPLDEAYLIENVVDNFQKADIDQEEYTYIDQLKMRHSSTDFSKWTTRVYYEVSLKEYTSSTEIEIQFKDDMQSLDNTYRLIKKGNNQFVLDEEIPLGNYNQVQIIIKDKDNYKTENIVNGTECAYLDFEIINHIDMYIPKNEYGTLELDRINYEPSFVEDEEVPFRGTFIFNVHNKTENNLSNAFGFDLFEEKAITLSQDLPIHEPVYISMSYIIYKGNDRITTGTIGVYQNASNDGPIYSYFVIESTYDDVKIL